MSLYNCTKHSAISAIAIMSLSMMLTACNNHPGSESQLRETVDSFATAYYNWRFDKAMPYCSADSHRWLRYAASQVHQEDVDLLRSMDASATVEQGDITWHDADSTADVELTVKGYAGMDTIGTTAHVVDEGRFTLHLKYSDEEWKVRMANLPRSEKPDRD